MRPGVGDEDSVREAGIDHFLLNRGSAYDGLARSGASCVPSATYTGPRTGRDEFPGPRRSTLRQRHRTVHAQAAGRRPRRTAS
ncbi:hypothetical protein DBP21_28020 [Streptomyces sp. CS147]|nr:hypothetical protein DBP21_28020 [Streptomyces sp. CS147]